MFADEPALLAVVGRRQLYGQLIHCVNTLLTARGIGAQRRIDEFCQFA